MRVALVLIGGVAAALVGCGGGPVPPNMSPGGPAVEVIQSEGEALRLFWQPPTALRVEIRHAESEALVWRASAGGTRQGVQALGAPLPMQPMGPPPDVHPPDGRGAEASVPDPLVVGEQYTVTVTPCAMEPQVTPPWQCDALPELRSTFEAQYPGVEE